MMSISLKIKEARIKKGLTQKEFASLLGCTTISISRYECATRTPSLKTLQQMAKILGISLGALLDDSEVLNG